MAMAAGCGSGSSAKHDANPPTDESPDAAAIVLPDAFFTAKPDTQRVPLDTSCALDGDQTRSVDGSCDPYPLQEAVGRYACATGPLIHWDQAGPYAVVVDCEGRAVELLNIENQTPLLTGLARQAWLDAVANDRWPCLAGQTIQFMCYVSLILTP